ncbi:hypothetical protein [Algibacter sp. 2305UL17-15]|uniref:hypothetical protein n=1 Tax=Algibacter sp. 2305UL17-15 TaxID=3231268 RepID=UPI00345A6555
MKTRKFVLKYYLSIKVVLIITGTCLLFIAYFFSDKPNSWETIKVNLSNPMMYLCLIISFSISLWITNSVFNKKGLKKE